MPVPDQISVAELKARVDAGDAVVVDVREPHEWAAGHVAGATHIPLGTLGARANELPRDRDLLMFCRSGGRSEMARQMLAGAGFDRVTNVAGGILAWQAAGYPLER